MSHPLIGRRPQRVLVIPWEIPGLPQSSQWTLAVYPTDWLTLRNILWLSPDPCSRHQPRANLRVLPNLAASQPARANSKKEVCPLASVWMWSEAEVTRKSANSVSCYRMVTTHNKYSETGVPGMLWGTAVIQSKCCSFSSATFRASTAFPAGSQDDGLSFPSSPDLVFKQEELFPLHVSLFL